MAVTAWTPAELAVINGNDEVRISSLRDDGALGSERTIWTVTDGDSVYVRSVNGPAAAWFRGTRARHAGHIRIGHLDKDVTMTDADDSVNDSVDAAYRAKYRTYAASIVDSINTPTARSTTMRLDPR
jgi:hypothetical protein